MIYDWEWYTTLPKPEKWLLRALLALLGAVLVWGVAGCSITHGESSAHLANFPPGDEIKTRTVTDIGLAIDPKEMVIHIGYRRYQKSTVPAFDKDAMIPDVQVRTVVDANTGGYIGEELLVGTLEP